MLFHWLWEKTGINPVCVSRKLNVCRKLKIFIVFLIVFFQFDFQGNGSQIEKKANKEKEPKPVYVIKKATGKIKIDGYLNEKAWEDALLISVDTEILPGENVEAPVKTECYLHYDENTLYVGFKAYDPHPDQVRANYSDRDSGLQDDMVAIVLDTFNDENRAFVFFSTALGVQLDEIFSEGGNSEDVSWDAIWNSAGHIGAEGYEVEMAIPFRSLQFQHSSKSQVWGFAAFRIYPRSLRHKLANFRFDRGNSCLVCQFPKLEGVIGAAPGRNIELDPTVTAFRTDTRKEFPQGPMKKKDSKLDAGISGHWGFTPNLTLSATINPDFSQVEADAVQLDINTQFALSYPEKRSFFLEGKDFFKTDINAVYTRAVADPLWGVKVSGKEGKNALGFFVSRDSTTNLLFPGAYGSNSTTLNQGSTVTAFRYRRDIGSSSTIGFLVTDREGHNYYNRLGGVDGILRITNSDTIRFQVLGASTKYPSSTANEFNQKQGNLNGYAVKLSYSRQTRSLGLNADYLDFSPNFRADLGFVPQVNYRNSNLGGTYTFWGKNDRFFSRIEVGGNLSQTQDHHGNLLEREAELSLEMDMPFQSTFEISAGARRKVYNSTIFNQEFFELFFNSRLNGKLFIGCDVQVRDEIDYAHTRPGKLFHILSEIDYNLGKHIMAIFAHIYSHLDVEGGRLYSTHVLQGLLYYHFNNRMFLRGILQYTDISRNSSLFANAITPKYKYLFTQFLFSYKLNPRTVFFLGYSDDYLGYIDIPLKQSNRTFFFKIGYALSM